MSLFTHKKLGPFHILSDLCWTAGTVGVFYVGMTFELPTKPLPTFFAALLVAWLFGAARCLDRQGTPASLAKAARDIARMTGHLLLLTAIASPLYWRSIPVLGSLSACWGHWLGAVLLLGAACLIVKNRFYEGAIGMGALILITAFGLADAITGVVRALL
jgi:hypothetical protein